MAHDTGLGIVLVEFLQQFEKSMLLLLGSSVSSNASLIITSFITDAERAMVVVAGVNALDSLGKDGNHIAIASDIVVIGGLAETGIACGYEASDSEGLVAAGTGAMND